MDIQTGDMMEFLGVLNRFLDGLAQCRSFGDRVSCDELKIIGSQSSLLQNLNEDMSLDDYFIFLKLRNSLQEIVHELHSCQSNLSETSQSYVNSLSKEDNSTDSVNISQESLSGKFGEIALGIAQELLHFHKAASSKLTPLVNCVSSEDDKEKDNVITAWRTISEANKSLRQNYGLERKDIQQMLSWLHGKDLSESSRKHLNSKVDTLIQEYKLRLTQVALDDIDIPAPFCQFPDGLDDVLKDCCSDVECLAAGSQETPQCREEYESLILREIPQTRLQINSDQFGAASPGKAFENSRLKMHAARNLAINHAKLLNVEASKEQLELFSLKLLATTCISISHFACRTAVVMAYGKKNLIKVKPCPTKADYEPALIVERGGILLVRVPTIWWLSEDEELFAAVRGSVSSSAPVAVVKAVYELGFDLFATIENGDEPLPTVHVELASNLDVDREGIFISSVMLGSKNLRKQFTKATSKLFNWKQMPFLSRSTTQLEKLSLSMEQLSNTDAVATNETRKKHSKEAEDNDQFETKLDFGGNDRDDCSLPVRPPRPNRDAKKRVRSRSQSLCKSTSVTDTGAASNKDGWFTSSYLSRSLSSIPIAKPPAAVASFQELQEVIDFLSSSSTSSVCIGAGAVAGSEVGEKGTTKSNRGKREARKRKSKQKKKALQAATQSEKQATEKDSPTQAVVIADSGIGSNASMQSAGSEATTISNSPCDMSIADAEQSDSKATAMEEKTKLENDSILLKGATVEASTPLHSVTTPHESMQMEKAVELKQILAAPPSLIEGSLPFFHPSNHPDIPPVSASPGGLHCCPDDSRQHVVKNSSQESVYYSAWSLNDLKRERTDQPCMDQIQDTVLSASLNDVFCSDDEEAEAAAAPVVRTDWPNDLSDKLASIWLNPKPTAEDHFKADIWSSRSESDASGAASTVHASNTIASGWQAETTGATQKAPAGPMQRSNSFRCPKRPPGFEDNTILYNSEHLQLNRDKLRRCNSVSHAMAHQRPPLTLSEKTLPNMHAWDFNQPSGAASSTANIQDAGSWFQMGLQGISTATGSLPGVSSSGGAQPPPPDYRCWRGSQPFQGKQPPIDPLLLSRNPSWTAGVHNHRNRSLDSMHGSPSDGRFAGMGAASKPTNDSLGCNHSSYDPVAQQWIP